MILAAFAASAASAATIVIDFETADDGTDWSHGDVVTSSKGVTITTENFHEDFDLGVIFNSTLDGTQDPDLEGPPWTNGNLPNNTVLGNLLIIQENFDGCDDGTCDKPDDEGSRSGGELGGAPVNGAGQFTFDFSEYTHSGHTVASFGFDFVDVESAEAVNSVVFYQGTTEVQMAFASFDGVTFGDNTANHVAPFLAVQLGLDRFDKVVIRLGGSGGIDNIAYTPVPEPSTALLLATGIAGLARRRVRSS